MIEFQSFGAMRRHEQDTGLLAARGATPFRQPLLKEGQRHLGAAGILGKGVDGLFQHGPPA